MPDLAMAKPAEDKPADDKPGRTRKQHTRSRTGCLTCRKRHRRCDEQRPVCGNCASTSRQCEYTAPGLPLRERRKACLPGEQQPWAPAGGALVSLSRVVGPCASHPISMPFKSTELFHYFYDLQDPADIAPKEKRQGLLKSVMQSPDALRNTMLIAGLHYAWNAGHLKNFEPTLLFHKIETMRLINGWLEESRPKAYWVCVRQIATLCFTECCLGNVAIAETHLDGLMRFMDFHKPPAIVCQDNLNVEDELSNRYIILTYNFIYGFKSRLQDIIDDDDRLGPNYQPSSTQVEEYMHAWHKEEFRGLEIRLKAMKMIPFFFSPLPPTTKFYDVDGSSMIDCLISLTETSRFRRQLSGDGQAQHLVWLEGAATRLLLAFVSGHIESLAGEGNGGLSHPVAPRLMASWSGLSTSVGLYLHAVLGFWNAGAPIEPRLHRRVLSILKRDLDHTARWTGRRLASDFWFWRAFMGAFCLAKHARVGDQSLLEPLQGPFREFIRDWSRCSGVMEWAKARESLVRIVWPEVYADEAFAEELWDKSVN